MMSSRPWPDVSRGRGYAAGALGVVLVAGVALSLALGATSTSDEVLWVSRIPRTSATLLTGMSLAVTGLVLQLLVRNRFVEPSTVGSTESAAAGLLIVGIFLPGLAIGWIMVAATIAGLIGTAGYLAIISRIQRPDKLTVPLIGIIYGGVIGAGTTAVAYHYDLSQSLQAWQVGSFSGVIKDRYELLWLVAAAGVLAWIIADQLTALGLGRENAQGIGVRVKLIENLALVIVAVVAAITVTVVGVIPFIGLVVPNIVRAFIGDNARRALPWVAVIGALVALGADILARLLIYPYELPVGSIVGVLGAAAFLMILLHHYGVFPNRRKRAAT